MRRRLASAVLLAAAAGCGPPAAVSTPQEIVLREVPDLPADPRDPAWDAAPVHEAALRPQDLVEPRKLEGLLRRVRLRALTDGRRLAFRLDWDDATEDSVRIPGRFSDACAVQLPVAVSPDLPAPQMGEKGRPVRIAFWSASAQAAVDGRPDDLKTLFPNAQVDHYPFEAPGLEKNHDEQERLRLSYAPARAVGNPAAGPPRRAVQDLVAHGPGTLAPTGPPDSDGRGRRAGTGWSVLISRPLPEGLAPGTRTHASFAVWNGSEGDVASRKLWVPWTPVVRPAPAAAK
jgi:hypothetical protein